MNLNEEQQLAVNTQEGRYLVAAGAGSGKTAVLSERALKLIKDGKCKIEELLVLTFTNDAAKEMKSRIYVLLSSDGSPLCKQAVSDIESASIMTFDALARSFVNEFGAEGDLGYGNSTEVSKLLDLETRKILDEMLEERYAKKDPVLLKLVYRYCNKDDKEIVNYIMDILGASSNRPDPELWLKTSCDRFYSEAFISAKAKEYQAYLASELKHIYEDANLLDNPDMADATYEAIDTQYHAVARSLDEVFKCGVISLPRYKKAKGATERSLADQESWERIKERTKTYNSLTEPYPSYSEFMAAIKENEDEVRYLFEVSFELYRRVLQRKRESGLYFFNDIFQSALRLLDKPEVLKKIQSRYKYVMVDEYQDTSDIQTELLNKIGVTNIFMVGDSKQSIYRFRQANPKNFMAEKEMGKNEVDGHHLLVLSKNYRSRESVLSTINRIFEVTMTKEMGGIDYEGGNESLEFGNTSFSKSERPFHGYEVHRLEPSSISGDVTGEWLASDIYKKLTEGYEVFDKKTGALRKCNPSDFAILASSKGSFNSYKRILERYGIPCDVGDGEEFTSQDDVMLMASLANFYLYLTATDSYGISKRRHAYASIRKSYLFDDEDPEIYASLNDEAYMNEEFYLDALKHRDEVVNSSILHAFDFFFEHYDFVSRINRKTKVKASLNLLLSLREQTISMDKLNYSFADFASYFEDLKAYKLSSSDTGERRNGEAVTLFSIHKSKGLQYPIVYLPSLEKRFNMEDTKGSWYVSNDYGAGIPNKGATNPLLWLNKMMVKKESVDEEVRKFYVATTRAIDLLVFVELSKKNKEMEEVDFASESYNCYRNIVALADIDKGVTTENVIKLEGVRYTPKQEDEKPLPLSFKKVQLEALNKKASSPSKKTLFDDAFESRKYGLRMHRYMEIVDFKKKDISFIENRNDRERIAHVLSLPILQIDDDTKVYKEYSYINDDGSVGIIDLMFVKKGALIIIDYKSNNIDDPAYISQVSQYCQKAENLFGLKAEGYLLSLHKGDIKKVY